MNSTLVKIEKFAPPPHASQLLVVKDAANIKVYFLNKIYNNQGSLEISVEQAKLLIKELMNQLYGEI